MDIFRAYDIRGIYPLELNEEIAYKIGRALVILMSPKRVVVGRDIRSSSPALAKSLIKGIIDQGTDVIDIGLATSPMTYFSILNFKVDGGISVTASHNSREFNGLKIIDRNGIPITENDFKKIQEIVIKNNFPEVSQKGVITEKEILKDFLEDIFKFVRPEEIPDLKVATDAGNGMAGLILPEFFTRLINCQAIPLFWELDGSFPNHLPEPASNNLNELKKSVLDYNANLGIAFDGDADRVVFLDEKGVVISADLISALLIKNYFSGQKIIGDLRISWIVRDVVREGGGKLVRSRVGHSFIKQKMFQEKAAFGVELTGHYYLGGERNFESSFVVVLLVLQLMKDRKISELIEPFKKYFNSGELNFEVEDRNKALERVEVEYPENDRLDGISVESNDWRFNLRSSNTEEIVRLVVEAKTKDLLEDKKEELMKLVKGKKIN